GGAGLGIREGLGGLPLGGGFRVATRVGLATGEVMVDVAAAHDGGVGMVSGSVVNTASRLQAYAPQDTVVVCAATRDATERAIAYQELPPAVVSGKSRPLDIYRALHPQHALVLC